MFSNKGPLSVKSLEPERCTRACGGKHPESVPSYTSANQKLCPSCMLALCHMQIPYCGFDVTCVCVCVCVCVRRGVRSDKNEEGLSDL